MNSYAIKAIKDLCKISKSNSVLLGNRDKTQEMILISSYFNFGKEDIRVMTRLGASSGDEASPAVVIPKENIKTLLAISKLDKSTFEIHNDEDGVIVRNHVASIWVEKQENTIYHNKRMAEQFNVDLNQYRSIEFGNIFEFVDFFCHVDDENRPKTNYVIFDANNKKSFSTDGCRMQVMSLPISGEGIFAIEKRTISAINKYCQSVKGSRVVIWYKEKSRNTVIQVFSPGSPMCAVEICTISDMHGDLDVIGFFENIQKVYCHNSKGSIEFQVKDAIKILSCIFDTDKTIVLDISKTEARINTLKIGNKKFIARLPISNSEISGKFGIDREYFKSSLRGISKFDDKAVMFIYDNISMYHVENKRDKTGNGIGMDYIIMPVRI